MNKSYFIVPVILLAVFGFFYNGSLKEMKAKEEAHQQEVARLKAEDAKHKKEIEDKATADAQKRQDEREAADRAKEEKKVRDYEDAMKALKDETAKYATEADKLAKDAADLEIQLSQARTQRETLNRETFDLAKQVEQTKINRRNAEIEIQRVIEIAGKKLNDSSIAAPPPLSPLVPK
jgi:hypothetical protein